MKAIQINPSLFIKLHDYFVYGNIDYHDDIRNELIFECSKRFSLGQEMKDYAM